MSSLSNNINLLMQFPFYGETGKPGIKKSANAELLSEIEFSEKPIITKIKQFTDKKLLRKKPVYKQSIKKTRIKKLKNYELLRELPFYDDINISRKERAFKMGAETYDVEIIIDKYLTDSLVINKSAIKDLFTNLLR